MTLVALDIDGTLIDTRGSFARIVKELSGATDDDIRCFRATGGFNDDWELARALSAWIRARRPPVVAGIKDLADAIRLCGREHDPGDLAERCIDLYRGGLWRQERALVDGELLRRLAGAAEVAACTGRDRWELARAEELLGFTFARATTMEDHKKPDPRALLRLCRDDDETVVLLGDTEADRLCAAGARRLRSGRTLYRHVDDTQPAADFLERVVAGAPFEADCEG